MLPFLIPAYGRASVIETAPTLDVALFVWVSVLLSYAIVQTNAKP